MGADSTVVFFGLRLELDEVDVESAETEEHPYRQAAKRFHLQAHWGRESELEPYFLFIGKQLTWMGLEHKRKDAIAYDDVISIMEEVKQKLVKMGAREAPQLHVQIMFDQ